LTAQESEYTRQQESVAKAKERVQTLGKKLQVQADRQDEQAAFQKKLMARADQLMQKLLESREQELSVAEKEWGIDVARKEKLVKEFDERRHKVQTQYGILKRRLLEMQDSVYDSISSRDGNISDTSSSWLESSPSSSRYSAPSLGRSTLSGQNQVRRYGSSQIQTVTKSLSDE
jgi:peptidoglycan hydrolase CwlO-like protein